MRFTPKSQEEIEVMGLFPEGIYSFEVIEVNDRPSKNTGNEMITLNLKVFDKNGRSRIVMDWLVEAMAYKLRHFAETTGLIAKYDSGEITHLDCLGKRGYLKLAVEDSGQYGKQNKVKDYMSDKEKAKNGNKSNSAEVVDDFIDNDIPF